MMIRGRGGGAGGEGEGGEERRCGGPQGDQSLLPPPHPSHALVTQLASLCPGLGTYQGEWYQGDFSSVVRPPSIPRTSAAPSLSAACAARLDHLRTSETSLHHHWPPMMSRKAMSENTRNSNVTLCANLAQSRRTTLSPSSTQFA
eukprot:4447834-Pyramimonas_sp.AAC.2